MFITLVPVSTPTSSGPLKKKQGGLGGYRKYCSVVDQWIKMFIKPFCGVNWVTYYKVALLNTNSFGDKNLISQWKPQHYEWKSRIISDC